MTDQELAGAGFSARFSSIVGVFDAGFKNALSVNYARALDNGPMLSLLESQLARGSGSIQFTGSDGIY